MVEGADILLGAGSTVMPAMKDSVKRNGNEYEIYRKFKGILNQTDEAQSLREEGILLSFPIRSSP